MIQFIKSLFRRLAAIAKSNTDALHTTSCEDSRTEHVVDIGAKSITSNVEVVVDKSQAPSQDEEPDDAASKEVAWERYKGSLKTLGFSEPSPDGIHIKSMVAHAYEEFNALSPAGGQTQIIGNTWLWIDEVIAMVKGYRLAELSNTAPATLGNATLRRDFITLAGEISWHVDKAKFFSLGLRPPYIESPYSRENWQYYKESIEALFACPLMELCAQYEAVAKVLNDPCHRRLSTEYLPELTQVEIDAVHTAVVAALPAPLSQQKNVVEEITTRVINAYYASLYDQTQRRGVRRVTDFDHFVLLGKVEDTVPDDYPEDIRKNLNTLVSKTVRRHFTKRQT